MAIVVTLQDGSKQGFADTPNVVYPMAFVEYEHDVDEAGTLTVTARWQAEQQPGDYTERVGDYVAGQWTAGEWTDVQVVPAMEEVDDSVVFVDERRGGMDGSPTTSLPAHQSRFVGPCWRCGRPKGIWLVTAPYQPGTVRGRLLRYCEACRAELHAVLVLSMPVSTLDVAPGEVLLDLYRHGITGTDPATIAEMLDVPGPWAQEARKYP